MRCATASASSPKGAWSPRVADRTVVEIETYDPVDDATLRRLEAVPGVEAIGREEREQAQVLLVQAERGVELTSRLAQELQHVRLGRIVPREPTLEDAYIALVTRDRRPVERQSAAVGVA
jgi:ABC-2 type transport system ATP-binding protein